MRNSGRWQLQEKEGGGRLWHFDDELWYMYLHSHISEDVLTTTAAPSVTTVTTVTTVPDDTDTIPTDTIPNAVVVEINGFTPSTVKLHKLIHHLPYMMSIIIMPQLRMRSEVDGVYVRYSVYV